jgi:hypothetical protein
MITLRCAALLVMVNAVAGPFAARFEQAREAAVSSAPGLGTIAGVVVLDGQVPRPLRRVTLTLSGGNARAGRQTISDDRGRFVFDGLTAGRYTLIAEKAGFVKTFYGSRRAGRTRTPHWRTRRSRLTNSWRC